jgi:hypothetical protein
MACARVRYSGPLLSLAPRTIRHFGRQVRAVACEILQFCRPGGHLVLGRGASSGMPHGDAIQPGH